ncbi:hypothetical protein J3F84DRAFT_369963 [Trichoderma pleuroticola]
MPLQAILKPAIWLHARMYMYSLVVMPGCLAIRGPCNKSMYCTVMRADCIKVLVSGFSSIGSVIRYFRAGGDDNIRTRINIF